MSTDTPVRIAVDLQEKSYPVYLGHGLLSDRARWSSHLGSGKILVVSNDVVAPLYLDNLCSTLSGFDLETHIVADGEPTKTVETWRGIIDRLVAVQARRDACIIALGGGVVGDICGFAAASYMRGIRFVQAPTTLLSQVDASVGGKTGINHERGKNLIGAFHQPTAVFIDTDTLSTLDSREFNAGLAEVVKYGAIMDAGFFDWLDSASGDVAARDEGALVHLIERSVRCKARIVAADEKEAGVRALLNFGHSFGHAIEAVSAYERFLHGEAVSIGMVIAARLSENRRLCPAGTGDKLGQLLQTFGLPVSLPGDMSIEAMSAALALDKKALASGLRLILLNDIGNAVIDTTSQTGDIVSAIEQCRSPRQ
jgi:3-dehydroquinate synthase